MLAPLLATAAAACFGVANFLGGIASRKDAAVTVTANAHLVGAVLMGITVLLWPASGATTADAAWGAVAGVTGGAAVVALYAALALGRMGVVGPLTAAIAAALPALYDVATGTVLRPVTAAGILLALVAVFVVSAGGDAESRSAMPLRAVMLAVAAGVGFSATLIALSFTAEASGFVPLLYARVVSATLLGALAVARSRRYLVDPGARRPALSSGVVDSLANIALITAVRTGPLAVVAVLGALHPVITMLLARVFLAERLRGVQRAGVAIALVAVIMTALP